MYTKEFYIHTPVWNNAFSFEHRTQKSLYVPSLKNISSIDEIELWNKIAFSDVDLEWHLKDYCGLRHFYEMDWQGKKLYLFDNHNHAYFFWHQALKNGMISPNVTLYHVDEHADTRTPDTFLSQEQQQDLWEVFSYTNFVLNVWDYIIPAQKDGLIGEVVQIRSETNILEQQRIPLKTPCILNLDLDFFEPNLDYIDYSLKKDYILDIAQNCSLITVATSPYFIDQELALRVFRDIFYS